jgi:hypothetical protein
VPMVQAGAEIPHVAQNQRDLGRPAEKTAGHPKAPLSAREFVASYNKVMTAKTGNAELDRTTAGLQIHMHGKLARWGTVGLLK